MPKSAPPVTFAARLRELRQARELTIRGLADLVRLSFQHVSRLESGDGDPSLATLTRLADAFGCSLDHLAGRA